MVQFTHFSREHPWSSTASDLEDSLNTNALFVNYVSVGAPGYPYISFKTRKWCHLVLIIKFIISITFPFDT